MEGETKFDLSNRLYYLILVLVAGALIYVAVSLGFWFWGTDSNKELTVSGTAKAYVKPDVAILTLGVKTEGAKSEDVVKQNNEKMNVIIKGVKDLGIDAKDIQTSSYNLYPKYNYTKDRGNFLDGYTLDQQITVKVRDFDKISKVLDKATASGANNVGNLQITVDDMEKVKSEAREKAIAAAKAKATEIAKESGIRLGKVLSVSENPDYGYSVPMANTAFDMKSEGGMGAAAPSIEVGQKEVSVSVSLTYKLR